MGVGSGILNTTGTLQYPQYAVDSVGGNSTTFINAPGFVNMQGTLQPASAKLIQEYAKENITINYTFYTQTNILAGSIVGTVLIVGGNLYMLRGRKDEGGRGRVFSLHLERKDS